MKKNEIRIPRNDPEKSKAREPGPMLLIRHSSSQRFQLTAALFGAGGAIRQAASKMHTRFVEQPEMFVRDPHSELGWIIARRGGVVPVQSSRGLSNSCGGRDNERRDLAAPRVSCWDPAPGSAGVSPAAVSRCRSSNIRGSHFRTAGTPRDGSLGSGPVSDVRAPGPCAR